jgi:hypothetical protein
VFQTPEQGIVLFEELVFLVTRYRRDKRIAMLLVEFICVLIREVKSKPLPRAPEFDLDRGSIIP